VSNQEPTLLVDVHPPEARPVEETIGYVGRGQPIREMPAQVHGTAGQIAVTPSRADVDVEAVPTGNAVPIEEDQVVTRRFQDGLVADGTLPKAFVLVPHVTHRERDTVGEFRDERGGLGTTAIIGDQKLEVLPALPLQARKHELEATGIVVRCDNDG
jgi:hypothetical protein